jgi:hypothetical protein
MLPTLGLGDKITSALGEKMKPSFTKICGREVPSNLPELSVERLEVISSRHGDSTGGSWVWEYIPCHCHLRRLISVDQMYGESNRQVLIKTILEVQVKEGIDDDGNTVPIVGFGPPKHEDYEQSFHDLEFIAHAEEDMGQLLNEVFRLKILCRSQQERIETLERSSTKSKRPKR